MILYFADRKLNILGQASTGLPGGLTVSNDRKSEEIETGVAIFECKIHLDEKTRSDAENFAMVGNFVLRSNDNENELYTIIDSELDTKKLTMYIYAEDAGLDLLNEVVGEYEPEKAQTIAHYIEKFAYDSGFRIGVNQAAGLTKKLIFDNEQTVTARLASVAAQFGNFEICYSYKINGLQITDKLINIYQKRGQDHGLTLRLNTDIDKIVISKSIANLATALRATGSTPDDADDPINLRGYKYDDGDFYIDGDCLKSRNALKKWSRYLNPNEPNQKEGHEGHIVRLFNFDTVSQSELCEKTVAELKAICDMEINYEAEIKNLKGAKIGDRINIVDEAGELYLSTRLLQLKTSVEQQDIQAILGENLLKTSGISQKVANLAKQFAINAKSAEKALSIAKTARGNATTAQTKADNALIEAEKAQQAATGAATVAGAAVQTANEAKTTADNARTAVQTVENKVTGIVTTVESAQQAAENAQAAAITAGTKADEAATSDAQALTNAAEAHTAAGVANSSAELATTKAQEAISAAGSAKTEADAAKATAEAAKVDAELARDDISSLGDRVKTVSNTMEADYARKTDLTEATANLQTQISQNAAGISSTTSKVQTIDETANNAELLLQGAIEYSRIAREKAEQAAEYAEAAQSAADEATENAITAQAAADNAHNAASEAREVLDNAEADLAAALADLETVQSRADATEEEIAIAQQAVQAAQTAANSARGNAEQAAQTAAEAQAMASKAVADAEYASKAADLAFAESINAQNLADEAEGNAIAAQNTAAEAAQIAATAQAAAKSAKEVADTAQSAAEQAAQEASNAKTIAESAMEEAENAANNLATAQQNLTDILSRVDATEEEIAEAQAAVYSARIYADQAQAEANTAQAAANEALVAAEAAQNAADTAKTGADQAQAEYISAQESADEAQRAVDGLAVNMTNTSTKILQNAEQIALTAKKTEEVISNAEKTREDMQAQLSLQADKIDMNFTATTERIESVSSDLQEEVTNRSKHITFSDNGITITAGSNTMTIRIDNDLIQFERDGKPFGTWDGVNFHTGNIVIDLNQRAQIGPIAFVPRSDGSVAVLKVK